jgi:hypothetical protein
MLRLDEIANGIDLMVSISLSSWDCGQRLQLPTKCMTARAPDQPGATRLYVPPPDPEKGVGTFRRRVEGGDGGHVRPAATTYEGVRTIGWYVLSPFFVFVYPACLWNGLVNSLSLRALPIADFVSRFKLCKAHDGNKTNNVGFDIACSSSALPMHRSRSRMGAGFYISASLFTSPLSVSKTRP